MVRYYEPEFLPWDGRRVPVTFVSGYLGAGKTTLINNVLAATDRPIAVFVNDVGQINIDARLIRRRHGDTVELTDGCVCCSLSDGFGAAFDQLRARNTPPDHLIIELSGVADPNRVLPWARSAGFALDGVITLVDTESFLERLADPLSGHTVDAQVRAADIIVATKTEHCDEATIATVRAELNTRAPDTPVIDARDAGPTAVLQLGGRRPAGVTDVPQPSLFDRHTTELVAVPNPIDLHELDVILDRLTADTVRAKGICADPHGDLWLIQVVGRRRTITPLPEAETSAPTDLVVIRLN